MAVVQVNLLLFIETAGACNAVQCCLQSEFLASLKGQTMFNFDDFSEFSFVLSLLMSYFTAKFCESFVKRSFLLT